jgi:hypothetical protein
VRPADERVGVVDSHDAPVQGLISDQAAGGLDLGKLRHLTVLPARAAPGGKMKTRPRLKPSTYTPIRTRAS